MANLRALLSDKKQLVGDVQFAIIGEQKSARYLNVSRNGTVTIQQRIDRESLCSEIQACCTYDHASILDAATLLRLESARRSTLMNIPIECKLELEVTAHIGVGGRSREPLRFDWIVTVVDKNDNRPFWPLTSYTLHIREGQLQTPIGNTHFHQQLT